MKEADGAREGERGRERTKSAKNTRERERRSQRRNAAFRVHARCRECPPGVHVSVGSMSEAGHAPLCGFPKAKRIQFSPPLAHRHATRQREGEPGFSCQCGKMRGRVSSSNPSHRGGPRVGPNPIAPRPGSLISFALLWSHGRGGGDSKGRNSEALQIDFELKYENLTNTKNRACSVAGYWYETATITHRCLSLSVCGIHFFLSFTFLSFLSLSRWMILGREAPVLPLI